MPTYQYRCTECGHEFEARQRMSDDALTECPVCHGPVRRVVRSVGIVFKGSGFYVTDNRSNKSNGLTNTAVSSKEDSESKERAPKSDSTEKKPEATKEKAAPKEK